MSFLGFLDPRERARPAAKAAAAAPRQNGVNGHSLPAALHSSVLPMIFGALPPEGPLTVLDIGPARGPTVDFFGDFRCRLFFADLPDAAAAQAFGAQDSGGLAATPAARLQARLSELLSAGEDVRFDVCLLWATLSHLDGPALRELAAVLARYTHAGTRVHAFLASPSGAGQTRAYAIRDRDHVLVYANGAATAAAGAVAQSEIGRMLPGFRVDRTVLLQDGAVELLIRRSD